jgi:hypothetical protein
VETESGTELERLGGQKSEVGSRSRGLIIQPSHEATARRVIKSILLRQGFGATGEQAGGRRKTEVGSQKATARFVRAIPSYSFRFEADFDLSRIAFHRLDFMRHGIVAATPVRYLRALTLITSLGVKRDRQPF